MNDWPSLLRTAQANREVMAQLVDVLRHEPLPPCLRSWNPEEGRATRRSGSAQAKTFIDSLARFEGDRGELAKLRGALKFSDSGQAVRALAILGAVGDDHTSKVRRTVAGLFAHGLLGRSKEDLGWSCRQLVGPEEAGKLFDPGSPGPVARRFMHLLAADGDEVFGRVARWGLRFKAQPERPIVIDLVLLYDDLSVWAFAPEKVRERWAASFWAGQAAEGEEGEAAGEEVSDINGDDGDEGEEA